MLLESRRETPLPDCRPLTCKGKRRARVGAAQQGVESQVEPAREKGVRRRVVEVRLQIGSTEREKERERERVKAIPRGPIENQSHGRGHRRSAYSLRVRLESMAIKLVSPAAAPPLDERGPCDRPRPSRWPTTSRLATAPGHCRSSEVAGLCDRLYYRAAIGPNPGY